MPRAPAAFTQADVTRALKGAQAAGVRAAVRIRRGELVIVPIDTGQDVPDVADDLDDRLDRFAGGR